MRFPLRWVLVAVLGALVFLSTRSGDLWGAFQDFGMPTYTDPIAELQDRINSGEVELEYHGERGYLDSVLEVLEIPASSQTFVFSKTSLQSSIITPDTPRALYFNDDVYVGFVQTGPVLELGSIDPVHGTVFYTLSQEETSTPTFQVEGIRCISCHLPSRTDVPVPRLMVMSVMPNDAGEAIGTDVALITDSSPMPRRWGGWYVTGTAGNAVHRGNSVISSTRGPAWAMGAEPHKTELDDRFDVTPYLRNDSDIVALMLLVHQSQIHNLIGDASYAVRAAIEEEAARERFLINADPSYSERTMNRVEAISEPLVRGLLFVDAAPMDNSVGQPSEFAAEFTSKGIRDRQGRSLRDLDLRNRLLRYPLSYLVYSEQFDNLPDLALDYVYRRLHEVLSGDDTSGDFEHLTDADRQAIVEILNDTKPEFVEFGLADPDFPYVEQEPASRPQ